MSKVTATNIPYPKLYRLSIARDEEIKTPKIETEIFTKNGHGYELNPKYKSFGSYVRVLNLIDLEPANTLFRSESVGFNHTSVKANFEGEPVKLVRRLKGILPDPSKHETGKVILVDGSILLINLPAPSGKPAWRVVTEDGAKLSDVDWLALQESFGLLRPRPKVESNALVLSRDNLRGKANIIEILRSKLPDPENCLESEFLLPSGRKLYLRSQNGSKVWVALPDLGNQSLTLEQTKEIEDFLGLEFVVHDYPAVDFARDIVCWGLCSDRFFRGEYKRIMEVIKRSLPDPETYEKKIFVLKKKLEKNKEIELTFTKKRNRAGNLVWTIPRSYHSEAAISLGLYVKLALCKVPEDAIRLTGPKAQDFWVEAGESNYQKRRFYKLISERLQNPRFYDQPSITVVNRDVGKKCKVYLGQEKETRFWYVLKNDYGLAAEILSLTPKDPEVKVKKEFTGEEDELFRLIQQQVNPPKVEYDNRDDGTDRLDLQKIRGGRRIARVREGLEGGRKKKK